MEVTNTKLALKPIEMVQRTIPNKKEDLLEKLERNEVKPYRIEISKLISNLDMHERFSWISARF